MNESQFRLKPNDAHSVMAYRWAQSRSPSRAIIILSHGMGEHALRYRTALEPLVAGGYLVFAVDHRGHGASAAGAAELGDFGPGGFGQLVADLAELTLLAKGENPGLPVILLGHSMGSMAAQLFAIQHSGLIDGLALSGSAAVDCIAAAAVNPEVFGMLNAGFEPARTPFDWLSRDEKEVDAYIADPLCGFTLTPQSFGSLLSHGTTLADPLQLAKIRKTLPITVFSGEYDPLNRDLKALQPLVDRYRTQDLDVELKIYPRARHEILNEINRKEVVGNLTAWLEKVVAAHPAHHGET